jgi:hypothetical protein
MGGIKHLAPFGCDIFEPRINFRIPDHHRPFSKSGL